MATRNFCDRCDKEIRTEEKRGSASVVLGGYTETTVQMLCSDCVAQIVASIQRKPAKELKR